MYEMDAVATGACAARKGDSGGVQQLLHGQPGGQLQGRRLPVHAAGVRHGRRALHLSAGVDLPSILLVPANGNLVSNAA